MAVIEVVKYNGSPDVFAWKYPSEELGNWTEIIVNESQEAILFKGGRALDSFPSGRHKLSSENVPILSKMINLPFNSKSSFKAEVWYINKIHSLDIKWGTASPIQLQDPKYKVFIPVRSFGQFGIQIDNSRKFLMKLVGTLTIFDKESLVKYFRGLYLTKVKDSISNYLVNKGISVLEINAYLEELSEDLKEKMEDELDEYGIKLLNFYVNDINVPEDDSAVLKLKEALSKRAEIDILGGSDNPVSLKAEKNIIYCSECGAKLMENSKFCMECGDKYVPCPKCKADLKEGETKCSVCGYELGKVCSNCGFSNNQANSKFCAECGTSLIKKCSKCNGELSNNAKFCPECGNKVE